MAGFDFTKLDPVALARDRKLRLDIRESFEAFCRFVLSFRGQVPAAHHLLFIRELEKVARGETMRLIISAPQGCAKTTYASHLFPAWWLSLNARRVGKKTGLVLAAAHTNEFAQRKIGKTVRDIIQEFKWYLDIDVDPETSAMSDWNLIDLDGKRLTNANYRCLGVGGALFGLRGDLGIIEDPLPDWVTGQSKVEQDKCFEWYEGTFVPRLKPSAPRIIIATRLSENDLIGRVLERDAKIGLEWTNIRLPMCAEEDDPLGRLPGERLWPGWYTDEMEKEARANPMKWIGAWQQRPSAEKGTYFKKEWIIEVTRHPPLHEMAIYGASDFATSSKTGSDYTVHCVIGVDSQKRMWLLNLWRMKTSPAEWVHSLADLIDHYHPRRWAFEKGAILNSVGPFMNQVLTERGANTSYEIFPTTHDKETRARSIQGKMSVGWNPADETMAPHSNGGLRCLSTAHYYPDFRSELLSFPQGRHDDQVDSLGLLGMLIDKFAPPPMLFVEPKPFKMLSSDVRLCTVTLEDMWEANESRNHRNPRIL
jgi:predicted phage terminase large subunit-like protein